MRHGSLFSGIGGFDLAAEWMGWENVFHCEWNPFGQKVLKYYFPKAISYDDITKTDFTVHRGNIDILTGGFPCQPYSSEGKRLGKEDDRHLWPEMLRAIKEIAPSWVVGENVRGLITWNGGMVFNEVCTEMENLGYQVSPFLIPSCGVNTNHKRERIWFIAYSESIRYVLRNNKESEKFQSGFRFEKLHSFENEETSSFESAICTKNDGFPKRLDGITFSKWRNESIKAAGNAIVPQLVYQIFKSIEQYEREHHSGPDQSFPHQ